MELRREEQAEMRIKLRWAISILLLLLLLLFLVSLPLFFLLVLPLFLEGCELVELGLVVGLHVLLRTADGLASSCCPLRTESCVRRFRRLQLR